jgi:hypothetical protein
MIDEGSASDGRFANILVCNVPNVVFGSTLSRNWPDLDSNRRSIVAVEDVAKVGERKNVLSARQ